MRDGDVAINLQFSLNKLFSYKIKQLKMLHLKVSANMGLQTS